MADIEIKHTTQTDIEDDGTSDVGADEWNEAHAITGEVTDTIHGVRGTGLHSDSPPATTAANDFQVGTNGSWVKKTKAETQVILGLDSAAYTGSDTYEPAKGADDNYVTDAEKAVIGVTSGTNTGDQDLSGYSTTTHNHTGTYEPAKGADDNYVTDAEKAIIGVTTGTNTGDQDLSGYSGTDHAHASDYEPLGTGTALIGSHETVYNHGSISHSNRAQLDLLTGTNTGDQDISAMTHSNRAQLDLLTGTNTGDQDLSGYSGTDHAHSTLYDPLGTGTNVVGSHETVYNHGSISHSNRAQLDLLSGTNTGDQDLTGYSGTDHTHSGTYEPIGTGTALIGSHETVYVHGSISHSNRDQLDLVSGTNTGDQPNLALGTPLTANGSYIGVTITGTVDTNAVGVGAVLSIAADGNFDEADADAIANCYMPVLACESGTGSKTLLTLGQLCNTAWNWTTGSPLYLSTTQGTMTHTPPSGTDDVIVRLGFALSADTVYFNPGAYVEHV